MAERFSEFDTAKAAEALHTEPHASHHVAYGDGQTMSVGGIALEVYPEAGVARVTTPDARIELFRVPTYHVSPERLVFQQGEEETRTRLLVRSNGRVSFYPVSSGAESPTADEHASPDEMVSPTPVETPRAATASPDNASPVGSERQEPEQVQLTGRLGRDPWFGTRGEEPAAGFPLAVNDDQGKTTWHRVVVTGEVVDQLKAGQQTGQIKKGRLVQLSGIHVVQSEPTAKGGTRTTTEFHATAVSRIANTNTRPIS